MPVNRYAMYLKHMKEGNLRYEAVKDILYTISGKIKEIDDKILGINRTQNNLEDITGEEEVFIEELLGAAFVVCQSYITSIVSDFKRLHEYVSVPPLTSTDGSKDALCKTESDNVVSSEYTEIQIINGFANYFKHHDQWPLDWKEKGLITKEHIDDLGLSWNSISEKMVSNNWARQISSTELFFKANLKLEKCSMMRVFNDDFEHLKTLLNHIIDNSRDGSRYAIDIIQSVGAKSGSNGNMRTGVKVLGCSICSDLEPLFDKIIHWRDKLIKKYREELVGLGKIRACL